jgi:hypothetical protein
MVSLSDWENGLARANCVIAQICEEAFVGTDKAIAALVEKYSIG